MSVRLSRALAVSTLLLGLLSVAVAAAEAEKNASIPADQAAATPVDRYVVPEGDVAALLKFMDELQAYRPTTAQEFQEHRQKSAQALRQAAEKILTLETDKQSEAYRKAQGIVLQTRLQALPNASAEEKRKIVLEIQEYLAGKELERADLSLAFSAASLLERTGNADLAEQAYTSFGHRFKEAQDPDLARYGDKMLGSVRRMKLLGSEMTLEGKTVDGKPFQWSDYRGKVVLVDFWATWCGPCIAELPNVKRAHELYKDKGFDVVGISLDTDRERLEKFLEEQKLPWVSLFEDGAGWDHPLATYYGVMGIPTVILVDKDGKVVSMNARGPQLETELARLLGPVEEKPAPANEEKKSSS